MGQTRYDNPKRWPCYLAFSPLCMGPGLRSIGCDPHQGPQPLSPHAWQPEPKSLNTCWYPVLKYSLGLATDAEAVVWLFVKNFVLTG